MNCDQKNVGWKNDQFTYILMVFILIYLYLVPTYYKKKKKKFTFTSVIGNFQEQYIKQSKTLSNEKC